jgi:hypothetical protein
VTHQGLQYFDGRGFVWSHPTKGDIVGRLLQVAQISDKHYLVGNLYHKFPDGSTFKCTQDGIKYVRSDMIAGQPMVVPLRNEGSLLPCIFVAAPQQKLWVIYCL